MVQEVNIIQTCPHCGQRLLRIADNYVEFRPCEHYRWLGDLDSIGNDQVFLQGIKLRLLKR